MPMRDESEAVRYTEVDRLSKRRHVDSELLPHRVVRHLIKDILERIFGCWHLSVSRPFTISGETYQVCLNCGKRFPYLLIFTD